MPQLKIAIINGPNLNLLGVREPEIYGHLNFNTFLAQLKKRHPEVGLLYFQSNREGDLIDKLHEIGFDFDGIILNAAAYTHTSIAIADAVGAISAPVIEVHISNIHARESFRHHSFPASKCKGSIIGLGLEGYELALNYFKGQKKKR